MNITVTICFAVGIPKLFAYGPDAKVDRTFNAEIDCELYGINKTRI